MKNTSALILCCLLCLGLAVPVMAEDGPAPNPEPEAIVEPAPVTEPIDPTEVTNALLTAIAQAESAPIPQEAGDACEISEISGFGPFSHTDNGICNATNYGRACREAAKKAADACTAECAVQFKMVEGWPVVFGPPCTGDTSGITRDAFNSTNHCVKNSDGDIIGVKCTVSARCLCDP